MASEYEIGYGRPPRANQFLRGQSGNPNGRPKGSRNLSTIFREVMEQKIQITENGKTRFVTKQEAMLLQLVNRAVAGDSKATKEAIQLLRLMDTESGQEDSPEGPDAEKDQLIMQRLYRRMQIGDTRSKRRQRGRSWRHYRFISHVKNAQCSCAAIY